jgi:hypothetical protein
MFDENLTYSSHMLERLVLAYLTATLTYRIKRKGNGHQHEAVMKRTLIVVCALIVMQLGFVPKTFALPPKFDPGSVYCTCMCGNENGHTDLYWKKVHSCGLNKTNCKFNNPYNKNKKESGKLYDCNECTAEEGNVLGNCTAQRKVVIPDLLEEPPPTVK